MNRFTLNLILLVTLGFALFCESLSAAQQAKQTTKPSLVITSEGFRQVDNHTIISRLRILTMQGGGAGCDESAFRQLLSRHVNNLSHQHVVPLSKVRLFSVGVTDQGTHNVRGRIIEAGGKRDSTLGEIRRDFGVTVGQSLGLRTEPGGYYLMEPRVNRGVEYVFVLDSVAIAISSVSLPASLTNVISALEKRARVAGSKVDSLNPKIEAAFDSLAQFNLVIATIEQRLTLILNNLPEPDTSASDGTILSVAASYYGWPDHINDVGDGFITVAVMTDVGWLNLGGQVGLLNWGTNRQLKLDLKAVRPFWHPTVPLLGQLELAANSTATITAPLYGQFDLGLGGSGGFSAARPIYRDLWFFDLWFFIEGGGEFTSIYEGQHSETNFGPYARSGTQLRLGGHAKSEARAAESVPGYNAPW